MNNAEFTISPAAHYCDEPLVTAEQAAVALNLPLYYFLNTRKRAQLGIPYYVIHRMVRYRIRELHQWQVGYAARQSAKTADCAIPNLAVERSGGAHA